MAFQRLSQSLTWCAGRELWAQPSLFVGWMSGGVFWPPWKGERNPFADPMMVARSAAFARRAAEAIAPYHGGLLWRYPSEAGIAAAGPGPLWFVEALLVFSCIYVVWRLLLGPVAAPSQGDGQAPSSAAIALFTLALGVETFVVRIWLPVAWWFETLHLQLAPFVEYIALFVVVAYRRQWFAGLSDPQGRIWRWIVLVLVVVAFPVLSMAGGGLDGDLGLFLGGLYWQSLAYAVYILHAPVIIFVAWALRSIQLDLALEFVLVAPVAVALCFVVGHYARKLPLARDVL